MPFNVPEALKAKILPVRMLILDVDGVLTDGRIIYQDDGSEIKVFHVQDGHGLRLAQRAGIELALITGRYSKVVEHRAANLGITHVYQETKVKLEAYDQILQQAGLRDEQTAYVGDDLIDIPVMRRTGFAVTVPNAVSHVMPFADYVTQAYGGAGAVREVCELLLHGQDRWKAVTRRYLEPPLDNG